MSTMYVLGSPFTKSICLKCDSTHRLEHPPPHPHLAVIDFLQFDFFQCYSKYVLIICTCTSIMQFLCLSVVMHFSLLVFLSVRGPLRNNWHIAVVCTSICELFVFLSVLVHLLTQHNLIKNKYSSLTETTVKPKVHVHVVVNVVVVIIIVIVVVVVEITNTLLRRVKSADR